MVKWAVLVPSTFPQPCGTNLSTSLSQTIDTFRIISNGSDWRLCYAKSPTPYEVYLQARLDDILHQQRLANFIQFFRFFGKDAFSVRETTSAGEFRQGLDQILAASETSTQMIERHLKNRVDDVLQALCLGFVNDEDSRNLEQPELDEIYRNAIYLLYRMLFLFYAEARHLLPVDEEAYRVHSLEAIIEDVRRWQTNGWRDENPHALWARLANLCGIVDIGDQQAGVNAYNGGLFSDSENPYLRKHQIKNDYLARAIFNLAYMETKTGFRRIEYRDLSVRHLGTLYEGMLEYRLNLVRDEPVVVRELNGKRLYVRQSIAQAKKGETILQIGDVYFADDKGERKSSGSYYTPEDVVQYIVNETLLPKLKEVSAPLKEIRAQAEYDRQIAVNPQEKARAESYADRQAETLVNEKLLRLKILDPAMGSAHFLVAAGQMLTDYIIEEINNLDWPSEIPTDPLVWKRRVVERCLYGVDVNPLAQELAKLSLWLSSASAGRPLTFLDHHLRIGNSLYGASIQHISVLPMTKKKESRTENPESEADLLQQMFQVVLRDMLSDLSNISNIDSDRIEDVKGKGEAFQHANSISTRLQDIANTWLGSLFGLQGGDGKPISENDYFEILQKTININDLEEWEKIVSETNILRDSRKLAEDQKFFHWELSFPDAVIDGKCQFDIVIANPPYVGSTPSLPIQKLYYSASCGDLYAWLYEKAKNIISNNGILGMVVPLSLMFSRQTSALREFILESNSETHIATFDNRPSTLFGTSDAPNSQRVSIIIQKFSQGTSARIFTTNLLRWTTNEREGLFANLKFAEVTSVANKDNLPKIGNPRLVKFWTEINRSGRTLRDISKSILSETSKDETSEWFLIVPRAVRYFLSAFPVHVNRNKVLTMTFNDKQSRDLAMVLINSNIHYWYWLSYGDGFLTNVDVLAKFPVPDFKRREDRRIFI